MWQRLKNVLHLRVDVQEVDGESRSVSDFNQTTLFIYVFKKKKKEVFSKLLWSFTFGRKTALNHMGFS